MDLGPDHGTGWAWSWKTGLVAPKARQWYVLDLELSRVLPQAGLPGCRGLGSAQTVAELSRSNTEPCKSTVVTSGRWPWAYTLLSRSLSS